MTIHIGPLRLPVSNDLEDRLGDIRLRLYQAQLRRCCSTRILLEAPTSSGKTLAYLIRAVEARGVDPNFGTTVIVYPTNALAWDQAHALHDLITGKIGKKANLTVESDEDVRWRTEDPNADVDLYVLNGETLAALSQESKSSEGKAVVEQIRRNQARTRIVLTNPEVLYYIFLYRFARNEDLIDSIFNKNPPNLLILDEFHLYHGYTLATITYMLSYIKKLFDQIIFSSATPIEIKSIILEEFKTITAEPSIEGDTVRYPMDLELEGAGGILGSEDIPRIKSLVDLNYERSKGTHPAVKVLVILSSVITCVRLHEALEKEYPDEVTAIHGLIPPKSRPHKKTEFKSILVGTSAIEVGVDFDTASLIVEAHDFSSFVQRLGRGARHDNCYTTAFIPTLYLGPFREAILNGADVNPHELNSIASHVLPHLPSYAGFPLSAYAAPILLAILLNWTIERPAGGRRLNDGMAIRELTMLLEEGRVRIPDELGFFREQLLVLCKNSPRGDVLGMARKMSCRSSLDSIPAVFTDKNRAHFDQLSLHELPRLHFDTITRESLERRGIKIPWRMRFQHEFVEVAGIRQRQEKVRMSFKAGRFEEAPLPLTEFRPVIDDHDLEDKIFQILKGQPAYVLRGKEDWRLPGFYTINGDFLVVGGDAYLAWFIKQGGGG